MGIRIVVRNHIRAKVFFYPGIMLLFFLPKTCRKKEYGSHHVPAKLLHLPEKSM
jgi:hypothetical protein